MTGSATLDLNVDFTLSGEFSFAGGTIEVAAGKSAAFQ